jgi:hypothetical protein
MGVSHSLSSKQTKNNENAYPLMTLPLEILLEILSFLPKISLIKASIVNKQLHNLCWEPRFWDCTLFNFKNKKGPSKRSCHIAEYYQDNIYVHGGHLSNSTSHYIDTVYGELYKYNIRRDEWVLLKGDLPLRTEHSSVICNDKLYIIAGYSNFGGYNLNIFSYDLKNGEYKDIEYAKSSLLPYPRSAQTVVEYNGNIYMFGGWNGFETNCEFLMFNIEDKCWKKVDFTGDLPSARRSHCVVKVEDKMYIFGGYGGDQLGNCPADMHIFDLKKHQWEQVESTGDIPKPRSRAKMINFNGKIMLLGGWDRKDHYRDWYEYDLKNHVWNKIVRKFPFKEGLAQFTMVANHKTIYVFGGYDSGNQEACNTFWGYVFGSPKYNRKV